ncbi:DNA methyltransferase [Treponema sp. OMZ 790]|nr:DNA methyltransferase [Treponema sp. OMZ 790]
MGSGTTVFVANRMNRHAIGIDIVDEYCEKVQKKINEQEIMLFEREVNYG